MTTNLLEMHAAFPPVETSREAFDPMRHDPYVGKVPAEVAAEWREFGFGAYGDGLFWFVPPDVPILDARDWSFLDGSGVEILRTAFGNVVLWQGGNFVWLNEHTGKVTRFNPSADVLFNYSLPGEAMRTGVLMEPLFQRARRRLGDLQVDECYGFAPLPALGGAVAERFLIKTNLRQYVALAGQALSG